MGHITIAHCHSDTVKDKVMQGEGSGTPKVWTPFNTSPLHREIIFSNNIEVTQIIIVAKKKCRQ